MDFASLMEEFVKSKIGSGYEIVVGHNLVWYLNYQFPFPCNESYRNYAYALGDWENEPE